MREIQRVRALLGSRVLTLPAAMAYLGMAAKPGEAWLVLAAIIPAWKASATAGSPCSVAAIPEKVFTV
jgi:hypothetical protein